MEDKTQTLFRHPTAFIPPSGSHSRASSNVSGQFRRQQTSLVMRKRADLLRKKIQIRNSIIDRSMITLKQNEIEEGAQKKKIVVVGNSLGLF